MVLKLSQLLGKMVSMFKKLFILPPNQDYLNTGIDLVSLLVDVCRHIEVFLLPRTHSTATYHRCQSLQLGSPLTSPYGTGNVVITRMKSQHQPTEIAGCSPDTAPLSKHRGRSGHSGPHGQCNSESSHKQVRGTRSQSLMKEAFRLGLWAEMHLNSLRVDHISEAIHSQVDALSCHQIDLSEWSLTAPLFHEVASQFGLPLIDLFASKSNHQVPRNFFRF